MSTLFARLSPVTGPTARVVRVVTAAWVAATAVQLLVWLVACVVGMTFVAPFWLWTAVVGGALVAGLRWAVGNRRGW